MGRIYTDITQLIGHTPLYEITRIEERLGIKARVLVKLECFNPAGSAKDRVAKSMIETAERDGSLQSGATIIEPTSGNTGIGLAAIAAARGYQAIFVMPDTMSVERRKLLQGYGAQIVLTPGAEGMAGAIKKAEELHAEMPNSWIPGQFENPANPAAHEATTGPEIWEDTYGRLDVFVAGVGTGGTLSGVGAYLKRMNPQIEIYAMEPADSPILSGGKAGPHKIQGIGANFIPKTLDTSIYDGVLTVEAEDAYRKARMMAQEEGILVGISSGAALSAAIALAKKPEYADKTIVTLLPDTGERYLSTPLFEE